MHLHTLVNLRLYMNWLLMTELAMLRFYANAAVAAPTLRYLGLLRRLGTRLHHLGSPTDPTA